MDNGGYCTFGTVNCTVSMTCSSSNVPLRKSNAWDIHDLIYHNLTHDTYFRNKLPIVWYSYDTCNVQIVLFSIITLIAINYSFCYIAGGTWRFCVAMSHFFSDSQKYNRSWMDICSNCSYQYGLTNLVQLSLHLSCLCKSSLTFNLQDWRLEHVEIIVVPGKREGINSHCVWFLGAKTHIYPIAY